MIFFCNDTATTGIYTYLHTLSLHDALPICLVTQGEYLEFMRDGGYRRPELWLSLGWDRVCAEQWDAPLYWENQENGWQTFTLHGMQPLNPHAPVAHVSYYEADAYARWAQARLPREAEWEHAARSSQEQDRKSTRLNSIH